METTGNRILAGLFCGGLFCAVMVGCTALAGPDTATPPAHVVPVETPTPPTADELRDRLDGVTVQPCDTEDEVPTGAPCYWDATVQGNGFGNSFVVFPDGVVLFD